MGRAGFWTGLIVGCGLAALVMLALALAFPPAPSIPPQDVTQTPPAAPGQPETSAAPDAGRLLPAESGTPLIAEIPSLDAPSGLTPAPSVFDGSASGDPSLAVPALE